MKRLALLVALALVFSALGTVPAVGSSTVAGEWHRNNYFNNHEVLTCKVSGSSVRCLYTQMPEHRLGWGTDGTRGHFAGSIAEPGACPWYMEQYCKDAEMIAQGTMQFTSGVVTVETLAVQRDGSMALSWDTPGYYGSPFVCPWYRSFKTALMESPDCEFFG